MDCQQNKNKIVTPIPSTENTILKRTFIFKYFTIFNYDFHHNYNVNMSIVLQKLRYQSSKRKSFMYFSFYILYHIRYADDDNKGRGVSLC